MEEIHGKWGNAYSDMIGLGDKSHLLFESAWMKNIGLFEMCFASSEMYARVGGCSERRSEKSAGKPDSRLALSSLLLLIRTSFRETRERCGSWPRPVATYPHRRWGCTNMHYRNQMIGVFFWLLAKGFQVQAQLG